MRLYIYALLLATLIRLILIAYGDWQDRHLDVKYTDVDYEVVTDAARHVATGASPYSRLTFRYTPLLAYLLLPNISIHKSVGKLIFVIADICAALLLMHLCAPRPVEADRQQKPSNQCKLSPTELPTTPAAPSTTQPAHLPDASSTPRHRICGVDMTSACIICWLFNPYTATISTRGSGDALVTCMQLLTLALVQRKARTVFATPGSAACSSIEQAQAPGATSVALGGAVFGLLVHWRVFPVIYGPSLVLHFWHQARMTCPAPVITWLARCAVFGVAALGVFFSLGLYFYSIYGDEFLHETFLYHATRHDPRHNFSPHFLFTYLRHFSPPPRGGASKALAGSLAPIVWWQDADLFAAPLVVLVILAVALRYARHLNMCWLLTTIAFVAFNKVSTAQYFVWYLGLLPLVLPHLEPRRCRPLACAAAFWLVAQLNWLAWAYMLEFQGLAIFNVVWFNSTVFLVAHVCVMVALIHAYRPPQGKPKSKLA